MNNELKIMVIGSGGREHAIIKKLAGNKNIGKIYAVPGNAGMKEAECVDIGVMDTAAQVEFALENGVDFAVVTPDDPLAAGAADMFSNAGIRCFGPSKLAAEIESSKVFAKDLMKKYGIPTARYEVFTDAEAALEYVGTAPLPTVVKADGLALGKGVIIAQTRSEAEDAVRSMMLDKKFGKSGDRIIIEEYLTGPEVSVLSFTDGKTIVPMISSMDHKRIYDDDQGPNTGGMGTVAPNPYYTPEVAKECMEKIFLPTVNAMNAEGRPFKGCLYFGLMLTPAGPRVIEYNCRFGDPETQVVLPLLETDLFEIFSAVADGRLADVDVRFSDNAAVCVIMASDGYPTAYKKGFEITVADGFAADVCYAGAKLQDGKLVTNGGRVLGVVATATDLKTAVDKAYENVARVSFENACYRRDIGRRALNGLG